MVVILFSRNDGPFVKNLDQARKSFHVEKKAYFGGMFFDNYVHSCLKVHAVVSLKFL